MNISIFADFSPFDHDRPGSIGHTDFAELQGEGEHWHGGVIDIDIDIGIDMRQTECHLTRSDTIIMVLIRIKCQKG